MEDRAEKEAGGVVPSNINNRRGNLHRGHELQSRGQVRELGNLFTNSCATEL